MTGIRLTRTSLLLIVFGAAWLAAVAAGQRWLMGYETAPGAAAEQAGDWPAGSAVGRTPGRFTLLLFVHPHCPCSRASLRAVEWLLARSEGKADAVAAFVLPPGAPEGWERSESWAVAAAIPGARPVADVGGEEARRFGAKTSGQALLYDPAGRLLFRGGLTAGRGDEADNAGRQSVLAWLSGDGTAGSTAPVFGCPLFDEE